MSISQKKLQILIKAPMIRLLALQIIALLLYPLPFFNQAPQAAVLPPTLYILLLIAVIATNTGSLSLEAGRASLIFIQGINIVVRMMIFFPNLKTPEGAWAWTFLLFQIMSIGLSWYTMIAIEQRPLRELNIVHTLKSTSQSA